MNTIKYLSEDQMPTAWYNIQADLSTPLPPVLHPGTGQPITPVVASSSEETHAGRSIRRAYPNSKGNLGIAISEAVEVAAQDEESKYALGSVLNLQGYF